MALGLCKKQPEIASVSAGGRWSEGYLGFNMRAMSASPSPSNNYREILNDHQTIVGFMSERLELADEYIRAKAEVERAEARLEAIKFQLKEMGTWREGDVWVDVSIVSRETISLGDLKRADPLLVELLRTRGFVKTSESERLTVKVVPNVP